MCRLHRRPPQGRLRSAPHALTHCPQPPTAPPYPPQIDYRQIKEIRSAARAFGAWGDVVSRPAAALLTGPGGGRSIRLAPRRSRHLSSSPTFQPHTHPLLQVIFLKDGSRLELAGLERFDELVNYMESRRDALGA